MPNRYVSLRNYTLSCVHSSIEQNLTIGTLRNAVLASRDSCHNCQNSLTSVLKM